MFINVINETYQITETKGILTVKQIKEIATTIFDNEYKGEVDFCYLFGSYAKGEVKEESDVDLYVSTTLTGLRFVGLIERLREALHKKVDLIKSGGSNEKIDLINEVLKFGYKIYG